MNINNLIKKNGYYECKVNCFDELLLLLRPENLELNHLMRDLRESSLTGFIREAAEENLDSEQLIFRGQCDSDWELLSSIDRINNEDLHEDDPINFFIKNTIEFRILNDFQNNCDACAIQIPSDSNSLRIQQNNSFINGINSNSFEQWFDEPHFELAAFAQHYGVPTRLLDWTHHPLTAVYFVTSGVFKSYLNKSKENRLKYKNFAIWVFNSVFPKEMGSVQVLKVPTSINAHASHQSGCFSLVKPSNQLFKKYETPIKINDCFEDLEMDWRLLKIVASIEFAEQLYEICSKYNFNAGHLFRSADGAAKLTNENYLKRVFSSIYRKGAN
ncbi:FRG domain-containing protein [Acinetobacter gerneri]|uniref:FRG domain-containing protein n=1 Tax=Acinetobacter gerneri TaxID=202952 RepID=A0AAW8JH45_9GAMM|nr:FRG domain-containing protein [Acinetobacter gerneri]MDQ9008645.1 FRG domain-containing protein [Acinetobacter gerneri]MDQ9012807.1 FRG domain-containing protein [Acinetobacter gerneri]MDQ9024184.1 FRG domain-containing protein [Acinetobacter gerneri]MDQ9051421.1 FRG domain-containing protein [Acinetobacter gerneri]MDQ9058644.1 FRG domain-containing protein [Acinetobacter gerneri]